LDKISAKQNFARKIAGN